MNVLIKSAWGSDESTKACFAFLHANAFAEAGHQVRIFLLGEAVNLMKNELMQSVTPVGWPPLSEIMQTTMPRYLIERNFAERLEVTKDGVDTVSRINDEEGVKWLFSFLSADKMKTYCLYEAPNAEAIRIAARRANVPADVIIEIGGELRPDMFA